MNLPVPVPVKPYSVNWIYLITIVGIHILALVAFFPYLFSWIGLAICLVGVHVFGQGITIGYHRLLTHRSFKTPLWVERCFAVLGICCLQDTPARWVTVHRIHHVHSDEQPDPHTPLVNFIWSHVGWLVVRNRSTHALSTMEKFSRDLLRDPFYMYLEKRPYNQLVIAAAQFPIFFLIGFVIGWMYSGFEGAWQLGWSVLVWGGLVRIVLVWHITWSVNSLSHMFGYQNYDTKEHSMNNWLVAILTVGEGWHNNHHHDPSTACLRHRWWELDISYIEIKLLEMFGLAWEVVPPRHVRHALHSSQSST